MPFIDVVYKLNDHSNNDNLELRYSLRSLCNFSHIRNVYIAGFKPEWVTNVTHIDIPDHFTLKNKDANLINKLLVACSDRNISEHFLNMSDDQIFLKEIGVNYFMVPIYNNNILTNENFYLSNNYFYQRLVNTVNILKEYNLPFNCYETHAPYLINKHEYPKAMMKYDYMHGLGFCGNTLYFNTIRETGMPKDVVKHCYRLQMEKSEIKDDINDYNFLNFNELNETPELFSFLEKKFPNKSPYEK